jgi:PKD repeat protein
MYTVAVSDALGCTGIDTVFVTVSTLALDLGADLTVCGSVTLDAGNPGSLYNWNNGPVTRFITVTSSGNYAVTVTDGLGCTVTDNINVTITALNASYTVNDTLYVNQFSNFTNTSVPAGNGWVWDFGDGSPNDLTENPTHVYATPGVRTVTLIVYSGSCVDTYYYVVNVIYAVSVAEDLSNINNLLIYPNPSTGIFNVEADLKQASTISFEILDMLGRSLYSNTSASATIHNTRFDLSGYAAGVYTLRMEVDGRVISRRITLQ